jgi:8-oxo-dGTP diphosphatase
LKYLSYYNDIVEIHKIQREIIRELGFADCLLFSNFNIRKTLEPDLFNYHLQALVKNKIVSKDRDKKYSLTGIGKSILTNMDVADGMKDIKSPKIAVQAFIVKNEKILLAKRLKHPFKDKLGFMSGKVSWGENFEDTLIRECNEEVGILPKDFKLFAIRRCIDNSKNTKEVIFDSLYFIFLIRSFRGNILNTEESENIWIDINDLDYTKLLPVTSSVLKEYANSDDGKIEFYKFLESNTLEL